MTHPGIRLRILGPHGPLIEGDSDWLSLAAQAGALADAGADTLPDTLADLAGPVATEASWRLVLVTSGLPLQVWIQHCQLPDTLPETSDG